MSKQEIFIDAFSAMPSQAANRFGFKLAEFSQVFRAWMAKKEAASQLRQLDDRQLRDIGINRYDLPPSLQDILIAGRDKHPLLDLFPHTIATGIGRKNRNLCD